MHEWADSDSWRLLCKSQSISVEITQGRLIKMLVGSSLLVSDTH